MGVVSPLHDLVTGEQFLAAEELRGRSSLPTAIIAGLVE